MKIKLKLSAEELRKKLNIKEADVSTTIIKEVIKENPIEGKEIVEKINELAIVPELQIEKEHIKGLEDAFNKLVSKMKGGTRGGGWAASMTDDLYTKWHLGGSNITVSATEPSSPIYGDLWIDTS